LGTTKSPRSDGYSKVESLGIYFVGGNKKEGKNICFKHIILVALLCCQGKGTLKQPNLEKQNRKSSRAEKSHKRKHQNTSVSLVSFV